MPAINTAEDAVKAAERFISKYYMFRKLLRATREKDAWIVEFDVGVLNPRIARIKVAPATGAVLEYVSPEAK